MSAESAGTKRKSGWRWVLRIAIVYLCIGIALGAMTSRGLSPTARKSYTWVNVLLWVGEWAVLWPVLLPNVGPMD